MKNNTNALLKSKSPLISPSRHIGAIHQPAAIRIIDNSSSNDTDTDGSEDLNPTPRYYYFIILLLLLMLLSTIGIHLSIEFYKSKKILI